MKNKITSVALLIVMLFSLISLSSCEKTNELRIYDKNKDIMVSAVSLDLNSLPEAEKNLRSYLDIVVTQASAILAAKNEIEFESAKMEILNGKYSIYTAFDPKVFESIAQMYKNYEEKKVSIGLAVTDLEGNLISAFSSSELQNYAFEKTAPYSSFKPLSVYAPAIEKGIITYSSTYEDSPIKNIESSEGLVAWPKNYTGTYSNKQTTISKAVTHSLNTIAVRCLKDIGVGESISYLKNTFGLNLPFEEAKMKSLGEEEILGNIALGYLNDGVSPVDMAGYYQTFATGGLYAASQAVVGIKDADGKTIYKTKQKPVRVMTEETAAIMNKLLCEVVSIPGGTGAKAQIENIIVGGKTGTGDKGYWFSGFTPEYSVAVWHGKELQENLAGQMFSEAVSNFPLNEKETFTEAKNLKEAVYCAESGKLVSKNCRNIALGYYKSDNIPELCDKH